MSLRGLLIELRAFHGGSAFPGPRPGKLSTGGGAHMWWDPPPGEREIVQPRRDPPRTRWTELAKKFRQLRSKPEK